MNYEEIARMAMAFVLEDETWPAFIEWVKTNHVSTEAHMFAVDTNVRLVRQIWMANSPDAAIRGASECHIIVGRDAGMSCDHMGPRESCPNMKWHGIGTWIS